MRALWVQSPGAVRARAILSGAIDLLTDAEAAEFEHVQTHIPELDDVERLKPVELPGRRVQLLAAMLCSLSASHISSQHQARLQEPTDWRQGASCYKSGPRGMIPVGFRALME
jgi:hypothetical protein